MTRSVVAICTKDRPDLLARVLGSVAADRPGAEVVVVDASSDDRSREVCEWARTADPRLDVSHFRATRPGLARQRNEAARLCDERGAEIVHFLDDDAVISPGYFDAIEACFGQDPRMGGVGGAVQNPRAEAHWRFNRFFLLSGAFPYTFARSGRVVNPQSAVPGQGAPRQRGQRPVQWLQGFAMSYRIDVLRTNQFDERLRGYSYGEDRDFSFRVGQQWRLAVADAARCEHRKAESARMDAERFGFESTILSYAWMMEWQDAGHFSRPAYVWSALGDVLRHLAAAATGQAALSGGSPLDHARGVMRGLRTIVRGGDLYDVAARP